MRNATFSLALFGSLLTPFVVSACQKASQEAGEQGAQSATESDGASEETSNPSQEEKFQKTLVDCATAGKGEPLAKIADAVALINKMPKPLSIPCFLAAVPRPFELAATLSKSSAQPAKDNVRPRFILHTSGMLITVAADGTGKDHVEFSELNGSTMSVKGDLEFPITGTIGAEAPYMDIFDKVGKRSSCSLCHANERLMGGDYPAEATISGAIAPHPTSLLTRFDVEELARACEANLSPGCLFVRAMFHGSAPVEYKFPSDMPTR